MTYVTLITVGNLKEKYLLDAAAEYKKRVSAFARVEEIELREERLNEESPALIAAALETEGERILARIPEGARVVALCVEGKQMSSEALASYVGSVKDAGGKLCLIIGSSYGLSPRVKARADLRLSFSQMTFPHQLMRIILWEQVYRAFTILAGKRYHK